MSLAYNSNNAYRLQEEYYDTAENTRKQKSENKPSPNKSKNGMGKLKTISLVMLCFGVAFYVLIRYVAINEASSRVDRLKKELAKLESTNQQTQIELDRSIDLSKVEEIAVNKLGMQRPEKYQIVYIDLKNNDYGEVVKDKQNDKESSGTFAILMKTITNVLEYLY